MIQEQEAVRGRLFTIQDVMQSTVRAWLQVYKFYCLSSVNIHLIYILLQSAYLSSCKMLFVHESGSYADSMLLLLRNIFLTMSHLLQSSSDRHCLAISCI
jgi:hypothetical protein